MKVHTHFLWFIDSFKNHSRCLFSIYWTKILLAITLCCVWMSYWHFFVMYICNVRACSASSVVSNSATPWPVACQAPVSMGFPSWEYWRACAKSLQSYPPLCDPMDYSPPGFSVHGFLQARLLEWRAFPSSRGSSQSRDWTQVSCIAGRLLTAESSGQPRCVILDS